MPVTETERSQVNLNMVVTICAALTILGAIGGVWNTLSNSETRTDVRITADEAAAQAQQAAWQRQFDTENARILDLERWRDATNSDLAARREANAAALTAIKDSIAEIQRSVSEISNAMNPKRHAEVEIGK
jgi:hypothetical protein